MSRGQVYWAQEIERVGQPFIEEPADKLLQGVG
jgi:hypothetical protein